jgi:hypothetical protein
MGEPDTLNALAAARRIAARLDEDSLPYGIGGALALGVWGAPRSTKDVDLTVFISESELPRAFDALERAGVMIDRVAATRGVARIGLFNGRLGKVVVDVFLTGHPQYLDMQRRCVRISDDHGGTLSFISAEDLCIHKLLFARAKDIADLEHVFARRPELDVDYVRTWLHEMTPDGDARRATLEDLVRRFRP